MPLGYWTVARHKRAILALADVLVWGAGITAANLLRYQFDISKSLTINLLVISVVAALMQILVGIISPLYRSRWRVGSLEEILCLAPVWAGVTGMVTAVSFLPGQHVLPASATFGGGAMALIGAAGIRVLWRLSWERKRPAQGMYERTIIFGAGEAGAQLVDSLISDPASGYLPVAVLDDDPSKSNLRLRRLQVLGTRHDLVATAVRFEADSVVIAIPSGSSQLIREIADLAKVAGITTKVLPPVSRMLASPLDSNAIRNASPEDFLGRRVIDTRVDMIAGYLTGKRVLVTGAGGSIGSELCRQIHRFGPAALIMLDRDESALHQVQLSIQGRALLDDREMVLCDIRDTKAVMQVFEEHRPDVVFHAAALKHLPMLEMWPLEAVKTNVRGTQNVLDASGEFGVKRFVNISTDKAANPTSVLGYSKRLGERLTASASSSNPGTYLSVRFGNVLGSRGSVLKTFEAQLEAGQPLTVTHPDVVRFFMTVEEAVQLVIQAGAVGRDGEVLVLDMGEPVRIAEVAQQMLASANSQSGIVYTGLRPGEKLAEELFGAGEFGTVAVHPLITHVPVPPISSGVVILLELADDPSSARDRMAELSHIEAPEVIDLTSHRVDLTDEWNPAVGN
jgi:FlaA1/EpsC-like NDP-sugar epimerase